MKKKSVLIGSLSVLGLILLLLLCLVLFWLGPVVKSVVKLVIPKALGVPVAIESLTINPREGSLELSGFVLHNQDEFNQLDAVSVGKLKVSMDLTSVFSSTVVVHRVQIDSPYFTYEQSPSSDNVMEFIRDFQEFAHIDFNEQAESKNASKKPVKKVLVESMEINDVVFHLMNKENPLQDIQVGIEKLEASMTNGVARVSNITVSNPRSLSSPNIFTLDQISVQLHPDTIYSNTVSVKEVLIQRPQIYLENNPDTHTVDEMMKISDSIAKRLAAMPFPAPTGGMVSVPEGELPAELHGVTIEDFQINLTDSTRGNLDAEPAMLVGIKQISLRPLDGRVQIEDLVIANPPGFSFPNLFSLKNITISFDPDSMLTDQVEVREVRIESPEVCLEQTDIGGNVAELQARIMAFFPPVEEPPNPSPAALPMPLEDQPVVLRSLEVTNCIVKLVLPPEEQEEEFVEDDGRMTIIAFDVLHANPLAGRVEINDFKVTNPVGFANRHLVSMDQFMVDLDMDTLAADTLFVEDISIQRPRIAYERKLRTDNIQTLQSVVEAQMMQREENITLAEEKRGLEGHAEVEAQKVAIGHFVLRKGLVKIKLSILPSAPIPLPTIELKNIGERGNGASLEDALAEIGSTIYGAILGSVSSSSGYAVNTLKNAETVRVALLVAVPSIPVAEDIVDSVQQPEVKRKRKSRRRAGRPGSFF